MLAVRILCICGTGTVGANVVMTKLKELFAKEGIPVQLMTGCSIAVDGMVQARQADMIVSTSIMPTFKDVPAFHAISFYTGVGEDELRRRIVETARSIQKKRSIV